MAIYKDKKRGTYYISVIVEDKYGKKKRLVRRGFKTQALAKKAEAELIFTTQLEKHNAEDPTLEAVSMEYLNWYKQSRKKTSYNKTESVVRIRLLPYFKNKKIKDLTRRDVINFQTYSLENWSTSGAKRNHVVLSAILNFAIKLEYINSNVAREVGNINKREEKTINYWTLSEFTDFIECVDDLMYETFFSMLYFGGFRKGELLALEWKDIYFKTNTINVAKTAFKNDVTSTKTYQNRIVKLPQHTMNLLRQLKLKKGVEQKQDYKVFGEYHKHIAEATIDRRYDKYIEKAGVKRIRIHDFRHSHASYLINNSIDIQIVSKRLGHEDITTTYNTYAHLYPHKEDEAVELMEKDFNIKRKKA